MRIKIGGEWITIMTERYLTGGIAVTATCEDGSPYATLSVNMDGHLPNPGCFWMKDWSENEVLARSVMDAGLVELTGRTLATGFVVAKEARLK
jgi:hypothetical protein